LFVSFFLVNLALQNLNAYKNITGNYLSISMAVSPTEYFSKKKETCNDSRNSLEKD
jgi:hypothetical protein